MMILLLHRIFRWQIQDNLNADGPRFPSENDIFHGRVWDFSSTQPSTFRWMVKRVSAFGPIGNLMVMVGMDTIAAYLGGPAAQAD